MVSTDTQWLPALNYDQFIRKTFNVTQAWFTRSLTIMGRVLLMNMLVASLFVYKMSMLKDMQIALVKQIEDIIHMFMWKNKKAKIAIKYLKNTSDQGGLRLVDFVTRQRVLKIAWIFRVTDHPFFQSYMY